MVYDVQPLPSKTYEFKQSAYEDVPGPLPASILITAPSNSGKSVMLQNMITSIYKNCFEAGLHIIDYELILSGGFGVGLSDQPGKNFT